MNVSKYFRLFGLVLFTVMAAELIFVLQSDVNVLQNDINKGSKENLTVPQGAFTPGEQGTGSPSIIPSDKDTTKIEYRNILFRSDAADGALGQAAEEYPEL
jgi:hypothetical protein